MVINVYFPIKKSGECVGAISLWEMNPHINYPIWKTYKVYPSSANSVLFQDNHTEFRVIDGIYEHEMGTITIKEIEGFLNIKIKPNKKVK